VNVTTYCSCFQYFVIRFCTAASLHLAVIAVIGRGVSQVIRGSLVDYVEYLLCYLHFLNFDRLVIVIARLILVLQVA